MGKSDVSFMLLYPVFHRSSTLADVNFAAITRNSVNSTVLFNQVAGCFGRTRCDLSVVSLLKTVRMPCCCRQWGSCLDKPST